MGLSSDSLAREELASPVAQASSGADVTVPPLLQQGVPMLKVSAKKQKKYIFRLDPDQGQVVWQSKKLRIIPIENIKELRSGAEARYYREQFQLAQQFEDRWLTIVYVLDGGYKTLHLIAATRNVFHLWDSTVRRLYAIRQKLMSGLGNADMRQAVWEKQFWGGANAVAGAGSGPGAEQKLDFEEVERMCRRLNINPSKEDLYRRFKEADIQNREYLDFADFKRFVKGLKERPEIDQLYRELTSESGGLLTYDAFEQFMCSSQKSSLSQGELQRIFLRYASSSAGEQRVSPNSSPLQNSLDLAVHPAYDPQEHAPPLPLSSSAVTDGAARTPTFPSRRIGNNSAFADQHGKIYHDMTRPLPEYYISSSHNTYLVGHQLVGESTVEGYIRALLHSCRSVELDIYDGDTEPMVYHGRTLTSKVSLRDACAAIAKYAFVASPYPVIISAEIHCSVQQQDMIAEIMLDEFGPALVHAPLDVRRTSRGAFFSRYDPTLARAKNLYVSEQDNLREHEISVDTESSSTETSASDSDLTAEVKHEWRKARESEAEVIKDLKSEFKRARDALGRVRTPREPPSSPKAFVGSALPGSPRLEARDPTFPVGKVKVKMSRALAALLVYTVGVKCRGLNKKEVYAPEHMFSLSESTVNRILRQGTTMDLVKHNRTHLVRTYPKGMRIGSTNYEPHRYWAAGAQLVAMNWQTFDLGYMINHAMFQRNGRAGYVLKPLALRAVDKHLLGQRTNHYLDITVISAQQLPRAKDSLGREVVDKSVLDPFVEISIHVPDWPPSPSSASGSTSTSLQAHSHPHNHSHPHLHSHSSSSSRSPPRAPSNSWVQSSDILPASTAQTRSTTVRTPAVKNNGFNPVWEQQVRLPFVLVGEMQDLVFVRFAVKQEDRPDEEPLAVYCASLGSLNMGYRHLPLHDSQLSQYLFSTLFVKIDVHDV
ncbi:PLC-like phosphodiesterase [Amylocystis lapponica]|nr:PLC-like phosphodiesterase [Amylocystis lapponica]